MDPGVGSPEGESALERIVCVTGISSGAGLFPLTALGEKDGEGKDGASED